MTKLDKTFHVAGNATLKVGIVRDPDDLFFVLIQAPPAPQ